MESIFKIYYLILNMAAFLMMGWDKGRAKRKGRRIPERFLLTLAWAGGFLGSYAGMVLFHHKTRRWYFKAVFLLAAIGHIYLIGYYYQLFPGFFAIRLL